MAESTRIRRFALAQHDPALARAHYAQARILIAQTGYHRRDGELAELAAECAKHGAE